MRTVPPCDGAKSSSRAGQRVVETHRSGRRRQDASGTRASDVPAGLADDDLQLGGQLVELQLDVVGRRAGSAASSAISSPSARPAAASARRRAVRRGSSRAPARHRSSRPMRHRQTHHQAVLTRPPAGSDISDDSTAKCGRTAGARCGSPPRSARAARRRPGTSRSSRSRCTNESRSGAGRRGRGRSRSTWVSMTGASTSPNVGRIPMFVIDGRTRCRRSPPAWRRPPPAAAARSRVDEIGGRNPDARGRGPAPRTTVPSMK